MTVDEYASRKMESAYFAGCFWVLFMMVCYGSMGAYHALAPYLQNLLNQTPVGIDDFWFGRKLQYYYVALQFWAYVWLLLSAIRVCLLASSYSRGLLSHMAHFSWRTKQGGRPNFSQSFLHVLIEWWPSHLCSLYLLLGPRFYSATDFFIVCLLHVCMLLIWLMPMPWRKDAKSLARLAAPLQPVHHERYLTRLGERFQNPSKFKRMKRVHIVALASIYMTYFLTVPPAAFVLVQILRAPDLNQNYITMFRSPKILDWSEKNGYFALNGLNAPADVDVGNIFEYGRTKIFGEFEKIEARKKLLNIAPLYTSPDIPISYDAATQKQGGDLHFQDLNNGQLVQSCADFLPGTDRTGCLSGEDVTRLISINQILWDRFNALSEYKTYSSIPLGQKYFYADRDFLALARLKKAQILQQAQDGDVDGAVKEWHRFMMTYRAMTPMSTTMVQKSIIMTAMLQHFEAYEDLLYHYPVIATRFQSEIEEALKPDGTALYNGRNVWIDNWSQMEPVTYLMTRPSNAFLNQMYECGVKMQSFVDSTPYQFKHSYSKDLCRSAFDTLYQDPTRGLVAAFLTPGDFITNFINYFLLRKQSSGAPLVENMNIADSRFRMALLATSIIRQDLTRSDIGTFVRLAPPELRNPYTREAFGWNPDQGSLFFPLPGEENYQKFFYMNLQSVR